MFLFIILSSIVSIAIQSKVSHWQPRMLISLTCLFILSDVTVILETSLGFH